MSQAARCTWLVVALGAAGCRADSFTCTAAAQCVSANGELGQCVGGACAFRDPGCASQLGFAPGAPSGQTGCVPTDLAAEPMDLSIAPVLDLATPRDLRPLPPDMVNPCAGATFGGSFCGVVIGADQNTLFVCSKDMGFESSTHCNCGCTVESPGTPDKCTPCDLSM